MWLYFQNLIMLKIYVLNQYNENHNHLQLLLALSNC